jgi:serine/threonine protein kinase
VDFERCANGRGIIYLEYQPDPTLGSFIQNSSTLSEPQTVKVLYNLVDAVNYIHSLGISHHDIKPDNILYNCATNTVKLFDFGLALTVDPLNPNSSSNGGSPLYMAPEILLKKSHNVFLSDIWSIGLTLYEILVGISPFDSCSNISALKKEWTKKKDISLPKNIFISSKLRMVYAQMVKYEPEKRISSLALKKC